MIKVIEMERREHIGMRILYYLDNNLIFHLPLIETCFPLAIDTWVREENPLELYKLVILLVILLVTPKSITKKSCTIIITKAILNAIKIPYVFSCEMWAELVRKPANLPRSAIKLEVDVVMAISPFFFKIDNKVIEEGRWVDRKILKITRKRNGEVSSNNNISLMLIAPLRFLLLFKNQLQLWMKNPT